MHLSVEILGGYAAAKALCDSNAETFYHADYGWHFDLSLYDLNALLLNYRMSNGIYETGDEVVLLSAEKTEIDILVVDGVNDSQVSVHSKKNPNLLSVRACGELRHATLKERVRFNYPK